MERLTERVYEQNLIKELNIVGIGEKNADLLTKAVDKLAEYENLEEQGLLLKFPCKIGDVVFRVSYNTIYEDVIVEFSADMTGQYAKTLNGGYYKLNKFGKNVFLTREEAENLLVH